MSHGDEPPGVLDLFSGIGGFSLGLERAGMKTKAFCEIEPYCRAVLRKHWPEVPCYDDIRTLTAKRLAADGIRVNVLCGGFPCRDISLAGAGAGLDGSQSGLWFEYGRLIEEIAPEAVIIENSPALRYRGLDKILRQISALGYDAEWHCVPACALGAPHERDRIWIVAHSQAERRGSRWQGRSFDPFSRLRDETRRNTANPYEARLAFGQGFGGDTREECPATERDVDENGQRLATADPDRNTPVGVTVSRQESSAWPDEPALLGMDDGVPCRMDRVAALGNSIVPQIPELIGRAIMESWHARHP